MASTSLQKTQERIHHKLEKMVQKRSDLKNSLLLLHSDKLDFHWKYAFGTTEKGKSPIGPDNPYHLASIGKTFNSIVIARLFERGLIDYNDPISQYLSSEMLTDLFVYQGKDYAEEVRVRHLLNHTSGVADYYMDKPLQGKSAMQLLTEEPDRFWTPDVYLIGTFNNTKYMVRQVFFLIDVIRQVSKGL